MEQSVSISASAEGAASVECDMMGPEQAESSQLNIIVTRSSRTLLFQGEGFCVVLPVYLYMWARSAARETERRERPLRGPIVPGTSDMPGAHWSRSHLALVLIHTMLTHGMRHHDVKSLPAACDPKMNCTDAYDGAMGLALKQAAGRLGIVIDVGANGGRQTWMARNAGRRVLAVECLASAYMSLLDMFTDVSGVTLIHACAGRSLSTAELHLADDSSSLNAANVQRGPELTKALSSLRTTRRARESALVVPLDSLLENTTRCALVKLDTQGTEYDALIGMQQLIRRETPVVLYESTPRFEKAGSVGDLLKPLGYSCSALRRLGSDILCWTGARTAR